MNKLPTGLYELLYTRKVHNQLEELGLLDSAELTPADLSSIYHTVTLPLARELSAYLLTALERSRNRGEDLSNVLSEALEHSSELRRIISLSIPKEMKMLKQIPPPQPIPPFRERPDIPLSESALLTGSARTPSLQSQLMKELASCDRSDWLVSFIKYAGIMQLKPVLENFTRDPAPDGGPRLRIATTTYMGASDYKAIRYLLDLPNTELRMSYDTRRTRLHAKAYLFHRATGFSSAYIGSANISKHALDEGLEWTAKISQFETEHLWNHAIAAFESHWEDRSEFLPCTTENSDEIKKALHAEKKNSADEEDMLLFHLRPYGFQQVILEEIAAERGMGKTRHLIISATGTGKTMVAAFDYKNFSSETSRNNENPRLLFIAHREEILRQARTAFRQVLADPNFGELLVGGEEPELYDHVFCTVASWNSRKLHRLGPSYFDYIVLDEAHHAAAASYQRLMQHIDPKVLLGLTATPERSDGIDIRKDFEGAFTHELRLPEAVERALLSPFHYYGIPDEPEIDFSSLSWKRGRYDQTELENLLGSNQQRARWVLQQTVQHVADIQQVKGLGFCVSIQHAQFMADIFNSTHISSIALTGKSGKEERKRTHERLRRKEINFIFTVDLYNEGIDIPEIDTVLFLRPTESLMLFLQQLGRGLRLYSEKSHLTVLDFIAPQHDQFDFISRYRALTRLPGRRIDRQIEEGMQYVPAGCFVHLEKQAAEYILNHIRKSAIRLKSKRFKQELRNLVHHQGNHISLQNILDYFHLDSPDMIYKNGLPHLLLEEASCSNNAAAESESITEYKLHAGFRRLLRMDDTELLQEAHDLFSQRDMQQNWVVKQLIHSILWSKQKRPGNGSLEDAHTCIVSNPGLIHDLLELLSWMMRNKPPISAVRLPYLESLSLHASYTRDQVFISLGKGTFDKPFFTQSGVLHIPGKKLDVFFADINKSEAEYSPSTMYNDYAVTEKLFHWQSMSTTSDSSPTAQRYIHHAEKGYTPLLFMRESRTDDAGITRPYVFAGPLQYVRHEGSKPVNFIWKLAYPLPERVLQWARRVS